MRHQDHQERSLYKSDGDFSAPVESLLRIIKGQSKLSMMEWKNSFIHYEHFRPIE